MYNTDFPDRADLPSNTKLIGSTIIAGVAAVAILVTVVLPSEYGIDVTRVGSILGLTQMGQIKMQLAQEAAAAETLSAELAAGTVVVPTTTPDANLEARVDAIEQLLQSIPAQPTVTPPPALPELPAATPELAALPDAAEAPTPAGPVWRDEVSFTLTPMEGAEFKLVMEAGAIADYEFIVDGGIINFDAHGDGGGQSVSFEEGRSVPGDAGQLQAPFSGNHGWFFRNRGTEDVVVTLRTGGSYQELRRLI